MISNLNGSGSVRVHQKKAVFTGSRFRFGFGSTPWFEALSFVTEGNVDMDLSSEILQHFVNLRKEFLTYFPETSAIDLKQERKPFVIPIEKVADDLQAELIDFRNNGVAKGGGGTAPPPFFNES